MRAQIVGIQPNQGGYDKVTLQVDDQKYVIHLFLDPSYKVGDSVAFTIGSPGSAYVDGEAAIYTPQAA